MQQEQSFLHQQMEAVNKLAQQAVSYMEQKYGKSFVIASLTEGNFISQEQKFRMYAQGDDPDTSMATVISTNYGEAFRDNYFGIQVRGEYLEQVRLALSEVYSQYKVFSTGFMENSFDPGLDGSKTYQDAVLAGESMTGLLYIYTQDEENKVAASKPAIDEALKKAGILALIKVVGLRPPHLDSIAEDNFHQMTPYIKDKEKKVCTVLLDLYVGSAESADTDNEQSVQEQEGN